MPVGNPNFKTNPRRPRVVWQPLPGSQAMAIACPCHEILYHGTRGPGKTDAQLMKFRSYVGLGYGKFWRGIIFDREYKNLDDLVAKSKKWFPQFNDGAFFKESPKDYKWVWPTGEELLFRAGYKEGDYDAYHGHEYPFIGFNELTKQPMRKFYDAMHSCNRCSFLPLEHTPRNRKGEFATPDKKPLPEIPLMFFSTTNPHGCVPFGEVLTAHRGWVDIREIQPGEAVVTVDRFGVSKIGLVSGVTRAPWKGKMMLRKGRGVHVEFTPTHRFPLLNTAQTEHSVRHYADLPGQAIVRRQSTKWKGYKIRKVFGFDAGDFMELVGWYVSEGCMISREDGSERNSFQISQSKVATRTRIERLLSRMGLLFRSDSQSFTVTHRKLARFFRAQGKCRQKHIPRHLLGFDQPLLERMRESMLLGDGCGQVYYTISKQLADDFAELSVRCGYSVFQSSRQRKNRVGLSYEVNCRKADGLNLRTGNHRYDVSTSTKSINVSSRNFDGMVYCLTVPKTETFFIRQNGCVWLSGNSGHNWVKSQFIDKGGPGVVVRVTRKVFNPRTGREENVVRTQTHIFGSYKENRYLSPEYVAMLDAETDPNKRKAWLEGDWDIVAGGALDDVWNRELHVLPRFKVPANWRLDRSFDWGSTQPFSVGFWAEANGESVEITGYDGKKYQFCPRPGSIIRIAEIYGSKEIGSNEGVKDGAKDVAKKIANLERNLRLQGWISNSVLPGPADNAIHSKTERDTDTIAKIMADWGIRWTPSDKSMGSRINGLELVRGRFKASMTGEGPGIYFMDNCRAAISTLPVLPRDPDNPDDVDTEAEDHVFDEVRYRVLAGSNRIATKIKATYPV